MSKTKQDVLVLLSSLTAALEDSKNYAKNTYGAGVEDLLAQAKTFQTEYEADDELELDPVVVDNDSVRTYLDGLDDTDREELLADYAPAVDPAAQSQLDPQQVNTYLGDLDEAQRLQLFNQHGAFSAESATPTLGEPVFWAIGSATFTHVEDAQSYLSQHGLESPIRGLAYVDASVVQPIEKPDARRDVEDAPEGGDGSPL